MKGNSFKYLLRQGVKSLWMNRMMTLASVGVLTACLLIVGFAVLITENIDNMVGYVEQQNEIVVFVYDAEDVAAQKASDSGQAVGEQTIPSREEYIKQLQKEIEANPNVASVTYKSKEDGMQSMNKYLGENAYLTNDYEGNNNFLPDSFILKIKDLSVMPDTTQELQKIEGVRQVNAADDVASTLTDIKRLVNVIGWSIVAALIVVSLVIIVNTIRATIFARRKEINIMKYVGATNSFIRLPFVVEGVCLGLMSALVAYLIIWGGYSYILNSFVSQASNWLQSAFQNIIPFGDVALYLAGFFIIASVLIGVLGSALSIRNHIKV